MNTKLHRIGDFFPEGTLAEIGQAPFEFIEANGFLNLVWARLEFQLFWCVHYLAFQAGLTIGTKGLPRDTKTRLKWLHAAVTRGLPAEIDSSRLRDVLCRIDRLADERNRIVHSRYAGCREEGRTVVFQTIDVEDGGKTMVLETFTRRLDDLSALNLAIAECANEHMEIFKDCVLAGR